MRSRRSCLSNEEAQDDDSIPSISKRSLAIFNEFFYIQAFKNNTPKMPSEKSVHHTNTKKALRLSSLLDPLPILLGISISWAWKNEIDIRIMGPIVASGYLLLGSITWLSSKKRKQAKPDLSSSLKK